MRIKICGIATIKEAKCIAAVNVDAIGFVFFRESKRYVNAIKAGMLSQIVGPFTQRVGLFVNSTKYEVNSILSFVELDLIQFHGEEDDCFCSSFDIPYIKAISINPNCSLVSVLNKFPNARGLLLDTYDINKPGGIGRKFNWKIIPQYFDKPLIIAGGLKIKNSIKCVEICQPYGLDISGGVEFLNGGKSLEKIESFIDNIKNI